MFNPGHRTTAAVLAPSSGSLLISSPLVWPLASPIDGIPNRCDVYQDVVSHTTTEGVRLDEIRDIEFGGECQ